jgi:DNA-binding NarL/FixJ family response regulator
MNIKKPMSLLLIEDDVAECVKFKDCANGRTDIIFVDMTGSSVKGMQCVKTKLPEGVILDLELNRGNGSGIQFLADLKDADLAVRPIIVVTTNSPSEVVYNHVRDSGAALVFYKRKPDYCPDMVINHLIALRNSLYAMHGGDLPADMQTLETPEELQARISKRIDAEMDLIGVGLKYKGRNQLHESILLLISKEKDASESVINQAAINNKVNYSAIIRTMQTAINSAWSRSSIEDLEKYYTARINCETGVPSPTEFIHYYANKIRKSM